MWHRRGGAVARAAHPRRARSRSARQEKHQSPPAACVQERNYIARKEAERQRREMFDDALAKFKKGKVEEVGVLLMC